MSVPRPKVDVPSPRDVGEALRGQGLPPPIAIEPIAPPWVHQNYRLRFPPDSGVAPVMLRRLVSHPGYDTFQRERAALAIARTNPGLPVARRFVVLPAGSLPWPAALSDLLPGTHGGHRVRRAGQADAVAKAIGGILAILADQPRPGWGTRADEGRFVARRASWRDEWMAVAWGWWGSARAAGALLGPLTERLWAGLTDDRAALDTASSWCLVHDDLHPSNLLFTDEGLSGIVDWEGAFVGDPLAEWAQLLDAPTERLAQILAGYGLERARAVLDDPGAIARIGVYARSRTLKQLAFCGASLNRNEWGIRRAHALEVARRSATMWEDPDPAAHRIRAALDATAPRVRRSGSPAERTNRLIWQALESTRFHPLPGWSHAAPFAGALAASLLSRQIEGEAQEAWVALAGQAIRHLGRQLEPVRAEPIADREAWRGELTLRVHNAATERTTALACWWLATEGIDALGGAVSDDLLRGLETFVMAVIAGGTDEVAMEPAARLIHGLLGHAATTGLGLPGDRFAEQVQHAWEDLTLFRTGPVAPVDLTTLRATWPAGRADTPVGQFVVPALLFAVERVAGALPAPTDQLLGALGPWR